MAEYIEREALLKKIELHSGRNFKLSIPEEYEWIIKDIINAPAVDVTEIKHGKWIPDTEYYDDDYSECNVRQVYVCSCCGSTERVKKPYCHCSAKMDLN